MVSIQNWQNLWIYEQYIVLFNIYLSTIQLES